MPGLLEIRSHLVFYRKYHFNHTNVKIHLVCIPIILLSTICFTIGTVPLKSYPGLPLGVVIAWSYGLYYTLLDWQLGVPSLLFLTGFAHFQKTFYRTLSYSDGLLQQAYIRLAIAAHVVCWLAQFYGHAVHERRAPALFDNLLQALVLAPFFVVYEVAFWLGFKLDVKKDMDNTAGKLVRDMRAAEAAKKSS